MQGHMDSPLTDLGRAQAKRQGRILHAQDLPADTTYHCSPQGRARQTAELVLSGLSEAPTYDDRLKEVSVGNFEGRTMAELIAGWPDLMTLKSAYSWHYRAPGGERFEDFSARIAEWLDSLTEPTVVVTHGMVSKVLRELVLDLDVEGIANLPGGQGVVYHVKEGVHRRLEG